MADIGKKTGKQTQAGRDVYETPEGEMVSEKSTTFEYKGKWINIPTIHGGKQYSEDQLVEMLDEGLIEPTSVHDELEDAINAAKERSESLEFNKGGTPMMDEQMELFEEGGLKEEGGMVDEESGNDVPTGSSKEEVRDDIPAMLSEGEFVFPADVVRYHGLEKLMELRQEAKMGIKKMEAMGQMGNADEATLPDDIPFTMDDLIIVAEPMEKEEPQEKAYGGVLHAAQGSYVQPTINSGIVGYQPSIYSQPPVYQPPSFNPPVYQPPSSIVPTPSTAPTTGYSPLYQTTPTPAVAPKFEADAKDFTGVDPDKYSDPEEVADEAVADVTSPQLTTAQTLQQNDDGDKDAIRQLKLQEDRENQQLRAQQKQKLLKEGSEEELLEAWLANKEVLGAGSSLAFVPTIGAMVSAAGYKDQKALEDALTARNANWRDNQIVKDYEAGGFFKNQKRFFSGIFEDVKEGVTGFKSNFTKEGQETFYNKYTSKYSVEKNPLAKGATGYIPSGKKDNNGMPLSMGNLSVKEQQSYDNAVSNGDASVANHHASIARLRSKQDSFADSGYDPAYGASLGLSTHDMEQAKNYKGSIHRAIQEGKTQKTNTSGTGIFAKYKPVAESDSGENDSKDDGIFGGYSCYVATALNDKGYWPTIKKVKLIKWCMDTKPEDKFDTKLWRNGYTVFGKTVIAPRVDNKIIQWLSNGFYDATVKKKKSLQALIGLLFFYVPSYTIALYKMLRNDLVEIERT